MIAAARVLLADIGMLDDARLVQYETWLSDSERQRTFARPQRRRQFVAARALLRIAVGDLLDVEPGAVQLCGAPGRAPWLIAPDVPLPGLSVSHSGDWVACAVSRDTALGLDIEFVDPARDVAALAEHAFDAATCARLGALPEEERLRAFYVAWSEQEARIKLGTDAAVCVRLPHEALSVVVCGAQPLEAVLETIRL